MAIEWPSFDVNEDPLEQLIKVSRYYGSDPHFVLAGGGNTSIKSHANGKDMLHVKASGYSLANIDRDGFVTLDRALLQKIVESDFGADVSSRETSYKNAILHSRIEPQKNQRPSVESLLHHLLPGKFVVHTHCTLVNTLTCCIDGEKLATELFGSRVLWISFVDPGYKLGQEIDAALKIYERKNSGETPRGILMANHGMIVSGDTPYEVKVVTDDIIAKVSAKLGEGWQTGGFGMITPVSNADDIAVAIRSVLPGLMKAAINSDPLTVVFDDSDVVMSLVASASDDAKKMVLKGPVNPDQIVYCTSFPLWFETVLGEKLEERAGRLQIAIVEHQAAHRSLPRVVLVKDVGLFALGDNAKSAETVRDLYVDAIKIMSGAAKLGGVRYLTDKQRAFIENWEAEAYRRQIAELAAKGRN